MRVRHVKLLFAAAMITHAIKAKPTTAVAVNTTDSPSESSFTAGRDKSDGMMHANVLVKEVLAEATTTTVAAGSSTKLLETSTYTAGGDDGERTGGIRETISSIVDKAKNVMPKLSDVVGKAETSQLGEYIALLKVAEKHSEKNVIPKLMKKFGKNEKRIAELIVAAKSSDVSASAALKLEKAQMDYWQQNQKSVDDVFKLLGLTKVEDGVLNLLMICLLSHSFIIGIHTWKSGM